MIALAELPARLLVNRRRCSYSACSQKPDWNRLFQADRGIELQDEWLCSESCFLSRVSELLFAIDEPRPALACQRSQLPLGLVMISRGSLTSAQLHYALEQQKRRPGKRIGEVLKELGVADESQITRALAQQWSCPVFSFQTPETVEIADQFPLHLFELYRMLPVHFSPASHVLLLGFTETVHHSLLYATEQMLGCRAEPCLIQFSVYQRHLETLRAASLDTQVVIETRTSVKEGATILLNYARQLEAQKARVVRCGDYVWVRFEPRVFNVLLKLPFSDTRDIFYDQI